MVGGVGVIPEDRVASGGTPHGATTSDVQVCRFAGTALEQTSMTNGEDAKGLAMSTRSKDTQMDKAKRTVQDVARYAPGTCRRPTASGRCERRACTRIEGH